MDHQVNEQDFRLLESDKYTFSVLSRVLRGPCSCVRTDHQRLILCHTVSPYPVWIWMPDAITDAEKEQAWQLAKEHTPMAEGYRYNLKYELAEYFIARARTEGLDAHIATNMYAYDCQQAIAPDVPAKGSFHLCTPEDTEEAAELIDQFHADIAADRTSREQCEALAKQCIEEGGFFFWKDENGQTVACCSQRISDGLGCVGSVYTKPEHRRKHYAQHLVYQVTKQIADAGYMPMLYTDADYVASNACYEKIGYVLRGKLCTIAADETH